MATCDRCGGDGNGDLHDVRLCPACRDGGLRVRGSQALEPHDIASWAAFLPTVRVGGALPVTFRPDHDYVVVETLVPYVAPPARAPADPNKIPLTLPDGVLVPLTARYLLPCYSPDGAAGFLRHIVREIYQHEIDEQLRVGDGRPFAPEHDS